MVSQFLTLDAAALAREFDALFAAYPEMADDEELRRDMLDGETSITRVLLHAYDVLTSAKIVQAGIDTVLVDLKARKDRFARREDAMRSLMLGILEAAHLPKLELPVATLSVRDGTTSVAITDLEALPQGYFKTIRQADKTAIKASLEQGEAIPGAELVTGERSLTVRNK